jgi:biotin carboxyl carrier protein
MKFQFDIGDRERTVEIQRQADGYHVAIDGRTCLVDAVLVAEGTWSLLVRDPDGQHNISVEAVVVPRNGHGAMNVYIAGQPIEVNVRGGLGRRSREVAGASGSGPQRIIAPMPGKVVRVLVTPGEEVQPRQGLAVVEAMKMENELRAARGGRVREVLVTEGQSVDAGAILMVVE